MVKCSGTDHSIALEVQTLKQTSLLMSSASGKIFSLWSSREKYCWEMLLIHPKAGGFPFFRSPSPSLLPLPKLWGRSHCSISSVYLPQAGKVDKSDETGYGTYGGIQIFCKQRMSRQFGRGAQARQALGSHWRAICYLVHL